MRFFTIKFIIKGIYFFICKNGIVAKKSIFKKEVRKDS